VAGGFTFSVDDAGLLAALDRLGKTVERFTMPAAKATAMAVQREGRVRIARRTGATAEGILVREDYAGKGYVVTTQDVVLEGQRTAQQGRTMGMRPGAAAKWASRGYTLDKHVGLYLEKGTIQGKPRSHTSAPRPWLGPAADVEQGAHGRRMRQAIQDAIAAEGLGGE
jgi:hypothetical protein